jgi:hypothetical protein
VKFPAYPARYREGDKTRHTIDQPGGLFQQPNTKIKFIKKDYSEENGQEKLCAVQL